MTETVAGDADGVERSGNDSDVPLERIVGGSLADRLSNKWRLRRTLLSPVIDHASGEIYERALEERDPLLVSAAAVVEAARLALSRWENGTVTPEDLATLRQLEKTARPYLAAAADRGLAPFATRLPALGARKASNERLERAGKLVEVADRAVEPCEPEGAAAILSRAVRELFAELPIARRPYDQRIGAAEAKLADDIRKRSSTKEQREREPVFYAKDALKAFGATEAKARAYLRKHLPKR